MPAPVTVTTDMLTALDSAIAEGVLKVKYNDKEVTYRSMDEMLRIRAWMVQQLFPDGTGGKVYASFKSGKNSGRYSDDFYYGWCD